MANQQHLALIEQGTTVWNEWYSKNKRVIPDLAKANLSGLNLTGINLKKANLSNANLSHTNLTKAQLVNANLQGANFLGANLEDANLRGANLDYVILTQAKLNPKTIIALKIRHVYDLVNGLVEDKNFNGIDLKNTNLFGVDLSHADLSNAQLENANLSNANLSHAYLFKADLSNANLQNANLRNAYFSQANLSYVYFNGALCCGAYFKNAELNFANLYRAKFSRKTMIDLKWFSVWKIVNRGAVRKNLSGIDLSNANLQGVDLSEANLTNANLSHSILRHSKLDRANLTNTDLAGANVKGVNLEQANLKGAKLKSLVGSQQKKRSPVATKSAPVDSGNVMVKEKPTTIRVASQTSPPTQELSIARGQDKSKKRPNVLGLLLLAILASVVAGCYTFVSRDPNFYWQKFLQEVQPWKSKIEQLIPLN